MTRYVTRRWDPFRDLEVMQSQLDRLLGRSFSNGEDLGSVGAWTPHLDMYETGDGYVIHVDLPGMSSEDVDVSVDNNVLTIRGERKLTDEVKEDSYHRIERRFGMFARSVSLPQSVDVDGIQASFTDGVLRIDVPKAEQAKPRKIKVGEARRQIEA